MATDIITAVISTLNAGLNPSGPITVRPFLDLIPVGNSVQVNGPLPCIVVENNQGETNQKYSTNSGGVPQIATQGFGVTVYAVETSAMFSVLRGFMDTVLGILTPGSIVLDGPASTVMLLRTASSNRVFNTGAVDKDGRFVYGATTNYAATYQPTI